MNNDTDLLKRFLDIVATVLQQTLPDGIDESSSIKEDLALDSRSIVMILIQIESVFSCNVDSSDYAGVETVGDFLEFIKRQKSV